MTAPRQPLRLALLALAFLCAASLPTVAEPVQVQSEASHFTLRIAGIERTERVNKLVDVELALTTATGDPVAGAAIVLTGQRRYSSNPLPTLPQVSPEDTGRYRVRGLRFHMPGEWRLVFDIRFAQIRDRATFDVVVK